MDFIRFLTEFLNYFLQDRFYRMRNLVTDKKQKSNLYFSNAWGPCVTSTHFRNLGMNLNVLKHFRKYFGFGKVEQKRRIGRLSAWTE